MAQYRIDESGKRVLVNRTKNPTPPQPTPAKPATKSTGDVSGKSGKTTGKEV